MGRKPVGEKAMTGAERQKRLRERRRPKTEFEEFLSLVYGTLQANFGGMPRRQRAELLLRLTDLILTAMWHTPTGEAWSDQVVKPNWPTRRMQFIDNKTLKNVRDGFAVLDAVESSRRRQLKTAPPSAPPAP